MELLNVKRIAESYWWLMLLTLLAGGTSSAYFMHREPDLYEAKATVVVGPSDGVEDASMALRSLDSVSRRNVMATYAQIPSSRTVREGVREELALSREQTRAYRVRASVIPDTNVLRITVRGPKPQLTAEFTNSVVRQSQQLIPGFYDGIVSFKVLDAAVIPAGPIDPSAAREVTLGALLGFLLGLGLAFLIERFRLSRAGAGAPNTIPSELAT